MTAVLESCGIDLYIELSNWVEGQEYERLGFDTNYIEFMGSRSPGTISPFARDGTWRLWWRPSP